MIRFEDIDIFKARKEDPIGTVKIFGGYPYIKTENGWRVKPKENKIESKKLLSVEEQNKIVDLLKDRIQKEGYNVTVNTSRKDFGNSTYVNVFDNDWHDLMKIRISDHSVTNTHRVQNEEHIFSKEDAQKLLNKLFKKDEITKSFGPEYFEKAKKGAPLGTIKEFGGKKYIKAENGWKYYGKKKGSSQEEESSDKPKEVEVESKEKDKVSELDQFATKATDKQLEAAMKDPKQTEAVKKIAKEELEKRKGKSEEETIDLSEKEDKKQVLIDHLKQQVKLTDKQIEVLLSMFSVDEMYKNMKSKEKSQQKEKTEKQSEIKKEDKKEETPKSGFKKITQTYVKVGDGNIIIKMQGDNQYKATKGKFSLLSEPNESLVDFKKKVKEQYEKDSKSEEKEEVKTEIKQEESNEIKSTEKSVETNKTTDSELYKEISNVNTRNELYNVVVDWYQNRLGDKKFNFKEDLKLKDNYLEILKSDSSSKIIKTISEVSGGMDNKITKIEQESLNSALVENNQLPVCSPMRYLNKDNHLYDQSQVGFFDSIEKVYLKKFVDLKSVKNIPTLVYYISEEGFTNINGVLRGDIINNSDIEEYDDDENVIYEKIHKKPLSIPRIKEMINELNELVEKSKLNENVILSRRIKLNKEIAKKFLTLKKGDIYKEKGFSSFSLAQLSEYGDFQITLLAEKGQQILPTGGESEFITGSNSQFEVVDVGTNSIAVKLIDNKQTKIKENASETKQDLDVLKDPKYKGLVSMYKNMGRSDREILEIIKNI